MVGVTVSDVVVCIDEVITEMYAVFIPCRQVWWERPFHAPFVRSTVKTMSPFLADLVSDAVFEFHQPLQ